MVPNVRVCVGVCVCCSVTDVLLAKVDPVSGLLTFVLDFLKSFCVLPKRAGWMASM